jgi:hypothetical protein
MRRGWFIEELANPPMGTHLGQTRSHVAVTFLNWEDSIVAVASALFGLKYFEVQLQAGQIQSGLSGSPDSIQLRNDFRPEQNFFGVEVARYFVDDRNYFGRLAIKIVDFMPAHQWAWRAGLQTGTRATPSQPWDVEFGFNAFIYFNHLSDFILANLGTGRTYYLGNGLQTLRIGAMVGFGQKNARVPLGETLLFNIAPIAQYSHPRLGQFSLSIPIRVWVDRELQPAGDTAFLSEFNTPAARLHWSLSL